MHRTHGDQGKVLPEGQVQWLLPEGEAEGLREALLGVATATGLSVASGSSIVAAM